MAESTRRSADGGPCEVLTSPAYPDPTQADSTRVPPALCQSPGLEMGSEVGSCCPAGLTSQAAAFPLAPSSRLPRPTSSESREIGRLPNLPNLLSHTQRIRCAHSSKSQMIQRVLFPQNKGAQPSVCILPCPSSSLLHFTSPYSTSKCMEKRASWLPGKKAREPRSLSTSAGFSVFATQIQRATGKVSFGAKSLGKGPPSQAGWKLLKASASL